MKFNLIFICLMFTLSVFGQRNKYPKDLTKYCKIAKNKEGKNVLKCRKLPIDLIGAADNENYEIIAVCKGDKKFNAIFRNTSSGLDYLLIYTAEKKRFKWVQKIAMDVNVSNDVLMTKKILIECFFPDMNTLFVGYKLEDGKEKGFLVRLTHRGYRSYKSSFNPAKNSYYYKSEDGTLRPRY